MSNYNEEFRAKALSLLARRKWTLKKLAEKAGMPQTTVRDIMHGNAGFKYHRAMRVLDTLRGRRINDEDGD